MELNSTVCNVPHVLSDLGNMIRLGSGNVHGFYQLMISIAVAVKMETWPDRDRDVIIDTRTLR